MHLVFIPVVHTKDKEGNEYTLSGKWGTEDYNAEQAGNYTLTFSATTDMLRYKLFDAHNLLQVSVTVKGKAQTSENGCMGSISASAAGVGVLLASAVIFIRKNKNSKEE